LTVKKYPKMVQADSRGQIVIPKDIRAELRIDEGTGFFMYTIGDGAILLKKIPAAELSEHREIVEELKDKANALGLTKEEVDESAKIYRRKGRLEEL